jgi:protein TonB
MERPQVLALPLSFAAHGVALAAVITLSVVPGELPRVGAANPAVDVIHPPVFPSRAPSRPPGEGPPSVARRDPAAVRPAAPPVIADPLLPAAHDDLRFEEAWATRDGCVGCVPGDDGTLGDTGQGPGGSTPGAPPIAPVRVGGSIREPVKIRYVAPDYPEIARAAGVQGRVVLECRLTPEGRVEGVRVVSGHPLLSPAAAAAVSQWLYRPTLLNGVPVPVLMTVTVTFHMR